MKKDLKIVFAGTPDFAAKHLAALIENDANVVGVYTKPDKQAGRGKVLTASPVKELALEHALPVFQPETLRSNDAKEQLAALKPDLMIVVAYGLILPQDILDLPTHGCLNVHGSILPRWRGAAPIQRSIWAGDKETGITIMQMDAGLDTGDILKIATTAIMPTDTSLSMYNKLAVIAPEALLETISDITNNNIKPIKQDDTLANYAEKLSKAEAKINWQDKAVQLERNVRAFNPWPMSFFSINNKNIKVWESNVIETNLNNITPGTILKANKDGLQIATGENILNITKLQIPGKKALSIADVLNGHKDWFPVNSQLL